MEGAKYVICDRCHKAVLKEECEVVCGKSYKKSLYRYYCKGCMQKILKYNQRRLEWEKEHKLNTTVSTK